jgi:predicted double-glycine peptidase
LNINIPSKKELRLETVIRQQYDYSCGSAAVATLLTYHYGIPTPEKKVFEAMFKVGNQKKIRAQGFSMLDMKRYLDSHGLNASGFRMTLDQFAKIGVPGITLVNTKGYKHFVVVKGIEGDRVLLGDPAAGTAVVSRKTFEGLWNGAVLAAKNNIKIARSNFNSDEEWNAWPGSPLAAQVYSPATNSIALPMSMPGTIEIAR